MFCLSLFGLFVLFFVWGVLLGGALQVNVELTMQSRYKSWNAGLISVDRRTSLLSHVQYPDPDQSRLQRILHSQCQVGDD